MASETDECLGEMRMHIGQTIRIDVGKGHTPGGLWTLDFGIGGNNGDPNTLYFTDGINGEANGLFGAIFANGNGS